MVKSQKSGSKKNQVVAQEIAETEQVVDTVQDFPRGRPGKRKADQVLDNLNESTLLDDFSNEDANDIPSTSGPKQKKSNIKKTSIQAPTINQVIKGMILLAVIKEVKVDALIMALPFGFGGMVQRKMAVQNMNDIDQVNLKQMYKAGEYLLCSVVEVEDVKKKRVTLSILPDLCNDMDQMGDLRKGVYLQGCIKSVEDHGYMVDIGSQSIKAFCQFEQSSVSDNDTLGDTPRYAIGKCMLFSVRADSDSSNRLVQLSFEKNAFTKQSSLPSAGSLYSTKVLEVTPSGLAVSVGKGVTGQVPLQMCKLSGTSSLTEQYKVGLKIVCRVLQSYPKVIADNLMDTETSSIQLSNMDHIVSCDELKTKFAMGEIIQDAAVVKVDQSGTLVLSLNDDQAVGYASVSQLTDDQDLLGDSARLAKKFAIGSRHVARVIHIDAFSGQMYVSLQPSVVSARYFSYADVKVGDVVKHAEIVSFDSNTCTAHIGLAMGNRIRGFVPRLHLADTAQLKHPEKFFTVGAKITVRVMSVDPEQRKVVLTHKRMLMSSKTPILKSIQEVQEVLQQPSNGDEKESTFYAAVVYQVRDSSLLVHFFGDVKGAIPKTQIALPTENTRLDELFACGQIVKCRLLSIDEHQKVKCSLLPVKAKTVKPKKNMLSPGDIVKGTVSRIIDNAGLLVNIESKQIGGRQLVGRIHWTDISDRFDQQSYVHKYEVGDEVNAAVLSIQRGSIDLSLRQSAMSPQSDGNMVAVYDKVIDSIDSLKEGQLCRGFVKNIADSGLYISLGRTVVGRVKIRELFDDFVKDWKSKFSIGQLVECRVLNIDLIAQNVELSTRLSQVDPETFKDSIQQGGALSIDELEEGAIVTGTVAGIVEYGVFIAIDNTRHWTRMNQQLRGLCHVSELSDEKSSDMLQNYSVGDKVQGKILKIEKDSKRISIGLKISYFDDADSDQQMDSDPDFEVNNNDQEDVDAIEGEQGMLSESGDELSHEDDASESVESDVQQLIDSDSEIQPLALVPESYTIAEDSVISATTAISKTTVLRENNKVLLSKVDEEAEIARKELLALEDDAQLPQSKEDFERLLLGSPNSSFLWIQYMSFAAEQLSIAAARDVAEKALNTINFREDKEKFNVWIAYLNLEHQLGDEESMDEVLKRALQYNEPKHVYLSLVEIYDQSKLVEKCRDVFAILTKKFKASCKVWARYCDFLMDRCDFEAAQDAFKSALKFLPKRKHIKFSLRYAKMEYTKGSLERGRTIYETLTSNNPKRIDIWSMYIDAEVKLKNIDYARRLLQRSVHLELSTKKMKFLFKKYLDFEKAHGTEESVKSVVKQAKDYVESLQKKGGDVDGSEQ
ncbi:hypothetical protein MP228_011840 [Amoeboaphelidium protococcarum]|nr:hypothetical protein MP228_011840 [Amoeboaphelidium protococcarum]